MPDDPSQARQARTAQTYARFAFYTTQGLMSAGYICYLIGYSKLFSMVIADPAQAKRTAFVFLAVSVLVEALCEGPTGDLADRRGPQWAIRQGFLWLTAHAVLYVGATLLAARYAPRGSPAWAVLSVIALGELALAWGTALHSGSLNTWFVRALADAGFKGDRSPYMARKRLVTNFCWLILGGFALFTVQFGLVWCFVLAAASYLPGFLIASRLLAPSKNSPSGPPPAASMLSRIWLALREIKASPTLRFAFCTHALYWALGLLLIYFWQDLIELYDSRPETLMFAWIAIVAARMAGSESVTRLRLANRAASRSLLFITAQVLIGLPLLLLPALKWLGVSMTAPLLIALFAFSRLGQEVSKPLTTTWTHEGVKTESLRATIESMIEAAPAFAIGLICLASLVVPSAKLAGSPLLFGVGLLGGLVLLVNVPYAVSRRVPNNIAG